MRVTCLGTGTSHGIPVIGCRCAVCTSADPRNTRTRSSVMIEHGDHRFVVDTGQEFRLQAIREAVTSLDAVFYTHDHADHLFGIDDLRVFSRDEPLPVYGAEDVLGQIRTRFSYIFASEIPGGGVPSLDLRILGDEGIVIDGLPILPVPIFHGKRVIYGYRFGSFAYLTDCSGIPESSYPLLAGLDVLVIGALRHEPHPTHYSVKEAVGAIRRIAPGGAYLTHMCHNLEHAALELELPEGISPAYDGMHIEIPWEE